MTGTERASEYQFSLDLIRLSEAKEEEEDENDEDEHDADGMWHNWRLIDILAMAMDKALAEDEEGGGGWEGSLLSAMSVYNSFRFQAFF